MKYYTWSTSSTNKALSLGGTHAHKQRVCLACGEKFYSTWCGHRICQDCFSDPSYGSVRFTDKERRNIDKVYEYWIKHHGYKLDLTGRLRRG